VGAHTRKMGDGMLDKSRGEAQSGTEIGPPRSFVSRKPSFLGLNTPYCTIYAEKLTERQDGRSAVSAGAR